MLYALAFFIELFVLFLLSKTTTGLLSAFFYNRTRSKKVTIYLLSFLFLPGTLLHELSHYIMAMIFRVPVGQMELIPKLMDDGLKMGSVKIAKTDPVRRFIIGAAPFLFGTLMILGLFFYGATHNLFSNYLFIFLCGYVVFEVGNTMFSSRKDMDGALELLLAITIIVIVFYVIGFRLPVLNINAFFTNPQTIETFQKGSLYLLAPIAIDVSIITLLKLTKN